VMKRINFCLSEEDTKIVEAYTKLAGKKVNKLCYAVVLAHAKKMLSRRLESETRIKARLLANIENAEIINQTLQEEREDKKTKEPRKRGPKTKPKAD